MGLSFQSVQSSSLTDLFHITKTEKQQVIALAGNPNTGKSTVFNALTGLHQHTGNWPGKTVTNAQGYCNYNGDGFVLVDIPGTYSLMAHSAEEEVARDFICFGDPDAVIVVCDATCLERNLNLVLQTIEITDNVVVCINLMDEAKKKNITIDIKGLSEKLGVPVVATIARKIKSLDKLLQAVSEVPSGKNVYRVKYPEPIEAAVSLIKPEVEKVPARINTRWLCLKLLDYDEALINTLNTYLGYNILSDEAIRNKIEEAKAFLQENGITSEALRDRIVTALVQSAEKICADTVTYDKSKYNMRDRKIDRILTSKLTGFPVMALLLLVVFWLTITGANYPSKLLSDGLFWVQERLTEFFHSINAPDWLYGVLVLGVYRVVAWVVSVMLPPMAIFFPLFTLLEDLGYLPRVAFMLDKYFKKCCACGKQALTMWMVDLCYFYKQNPPEWRVCQLKYYSVLKATTGSFLAALRDGMMPAISVRSILMTIRTMAVVIGRTALRLFSPVR